MVKLHNVVFAMVLAVYFADCQKNDVLPPDSEGNDQLPANLTPSLENTDQNVTFIGGTDSMRAQKRCKRDPRCTKKGGACYPPGHEPSPARYLGRCRKSKCKCYKTLEIVDGPFGGNGGSAFSDKSFSVAGGNITSIEIWTDPTHPDTYLQSITVTYGSVTAPRRGSTNGQKTIFNFSSNERIKVVFGTAEEYFNSFGMVTNLFQVPVSGSPGKGESFFKSHDNCFLSFFSGRYGALVDAINLHWVCEE